MHLTPSDPDIATLYRKITTNRLDLQPNFQRGEVWGKPKKQRLIDSILRGWHIPPIHVIQVPNSGKQEVLDGQQRLAAIRDFIAGEFSINGKLEPVEGYLEDLDGLTWNMLPKSVSGKIEDFTIRLLTISDYKPDEPGELFYRLNQPTNLTSAEQRNAYFGEARQQVKDLSEHMTDLGYKREILGFSNSRMAYDDILSKLLLTLELGTLRKKITANTVTARYRDSEGFSARNISELRGTLESFYKCLINSNKSMKLNKASAFSWILFSYSYKKRFKDEEKLRCFFQFFEGVRINNLFSDKNYYSNIFLEIYQDRSSSRVSDISSVVLRDLSLWSLFLIHFSEGISLDSKLKQLQRHLVAHKAISHSSSGESKVESIATELQWGAQL